MTTALSTLEQRLSESIGDYLEFTVTTAIAASTLVVSTTLTSYDGGRDDYFIDWWVYITDKANAGVLRQVSDYATATGTLTLRGANLSTDGANLATCRLHRYNRDRMVEALNDTSREIYPSLFKKIDSYVIKTNDILPNSHFEDWALTTVPDKYALTNVTALQTSTAANKRGGSYSVKVSATAGNGYLGINSDNYPKLLDLMGQTVNFRCWAYPEVANDATLVIYTLKADGTAQTLTSTTTCPATKWTLLELENQAISDDVQYIEIRLKVTTNAKYVYFDNARLTGGHRFEYLLPASIRDGGLDQVYVQQSNYQDFPCDDLFPKSWEKIFGWEVIRDGTDAWLKMPSAFTDDYLIRLIGTTPLESTLSAYTDTLSLDGDKLNLYLAYAKYKLWQKIEPPVATEDIRRYESQSAKAYAEYQRLLAKKRIVKPSGTLRLPVY